MSVKRCAVYTRKSSEEGLEQDFNSLDAQYEACAAYVKSQASEGWTLVPHRYDDGGLSGGTLERPGLKRLLGDVAAGRIDIILVYKVDRLTRSLLDFARLVEAFDAAGTSFVSVTQSFNTTSSMGRLTLNMLLSFAQFEREVTAERIRDKLAASKAKGMWMGGVPPLGYAADGRSLAIVPEHADLVRDIYRRYRACGTVREVAQSLDVAGIRVPVRTTGSGRRIGGGRFARGYLYAMLRNPIYAGDIRHKDKVHPGNHPPLIARDAWDAVQDMLTAHLQGTRSARTARPSLLAGLLVDGDGAPLLATHACKGRQRYRYYVSRALHQGEADPTSPGMRLPAGEIERLVVDMLAGLLADPLALAARLGITITPAALAPLAARCEALGARVRAREGDAISTLLRQVRIGDANVALQIDAAELVRALALEADPADPLLVVTRAVRLTRSRRMVRLVDSRGVSVHPGNADPTILRLLLRGRRWWGILAEGELSPAQLAAQERVSLSYLLRILRLAFLAPPLVEAILDGTLPAHIDGATLTHTDAIPACWDAQRRMHLGQG